MKKAPVFFLSITAAFLCILLGFFIGRNFRTDYAFLPHSQDSALLSASTGAAPEDNTDASAATEGTVLPTAGTEPSPTETTPHEKGKYNLNTATAEQLQNLPGIGPVLAQRIIDYRMENGAFTTIEDICLVSGIGEKRFEQIRDYITIGG